MTTPPPGGDASNGHGAVLRAITYLSPGVPLRFYELVSEYIGRELGCAVTLASDTRSSGPMHGQHDPFSAGEMDLGFICSPSFLYLRSVTEPSVELVPAAFVMDDPRHGDDEPVYFSDVVVREGHAAQSIEDLADANWGYNDECSLSGYFAVLQHVQETGMKQPFFKKRVCTGSHDASLTALLEGSIDAAAIDSTSLMFRRRHEPERFAQLRVVGSFGPFPIQPMVVRRAAGGDLADRVGAALRKLQCEKAVGEALCDFGLRRCVAIDEQAYAEERRRLCALGELTPKDE